MTQRLWRPYQLVGLLILLCLLLLASASGTGRIIPQASAQSAWAPGVSYAVGARVTYGGKSYECLQAHTSQVGWEPPNVPALWKEVAGTAPTATRTRTNTPGGPTATRTRTNTPGGPTATRTRTRTNTPTSPSGFLHPGVLVTRAQLDFVKGKINAGTQPWKGAYDAAKASPSGSLSYVPHPRAIVECGPSSNPNYGCSDERADALAAYTHALLWYLSGNSAHARKSIEILNAWSAVLTNHTNHNARLQAGWTGGPFARAGELIQHTYTGWPAAEVTRFKNMLKTAHVPLVSNGAMTTNGNWELIMTDATISIGVFLDDRTLFNKALSLWRNRVPAYIYMTSDGSYPKTVPGSSIDTRDEIIKYWHNQTTFVNGLAQETCRDFGHTMWGLAGIINVAETARIQGVDLYNEQSARIRAGFEFHAKYINGAAVPSWLCGGSITMGNAPAWEIMYNHYNRRLGIAMPESLKVRNSLRPSGVNYFIAWETLTHADVGSVGIR